MKLFCKHEWKVLSETTTESAIEVTMRVLQETTKSAKSIPWQMCSTERKYIVVVGCDKCGKIKKIVENLS